MTLPEFLGVLILAYDASLFFQIFARLEARVAVEPLMDSRWTEPWPRGGLGLGSASTDLLLWPKYKKKCVQSGQLFPNAVRLQGYIMAYRDKHRQRPIL